MRKSLSIRWKLSLSAVGLVVVVTFGFGLVVERTLNAVHQDRADRLIQDRKTLQERQSERLARVIGDAAKEALAGSEAGRLSRILRSMASQDVTMIQAVITDEQRRVIAHSEQSVEQILAAKKTLPVTEERVREVTVDGERVFVVTHQIDDGGGGVLGTLQIDWSLHRLESDLLSIEREKDRQLREARITVGSAGLIAVLFGILAGWLGGSALSTPIQKLAQVALRLSEGDLQARSPVKSRDEIGVLGATMDHMAVQIGSLLEETQIRAELEHELAVARRIQQALLPAETLIERPGLEFCGMVQSASQCGGDWWSYAELTRRRTLLLVGDVTGHGVSSAMLTATAKSCLETVNKLTRGDLRVGELLKILDQVLRSGGREEFYMSCFVAIVDPVENSMTYANAGHNAPILLRRQDEGWRHGRLRARGNRLGDADGYTFVEHTVDTNPGDLICFYTDGLTEGHDPGGQEYGLRRLRNSLDAVAQASLADGLVTVLDHFNQFREQEPLEDDITCVLGRITA